MPPFPVAETNGTINLYKNLAYLLRFVKRFLLFSNHNLTILLKTRNSVLDKVSHSILSQPIHIVFFLYLLQFSRSFFADSSYMLSFSVLCSCVCSRLISPSVSSWHKQDNTLMHQSPGHIQRRTPYNF